MEGGDHHEGWDGMKKGEGWDGTGEGKEWHVRTAKAMKRLLELLT